MQPALYTIGYEGSTLPDFIATLKDAGIDILLDIRDLPFSRKPGFSKTPLMAALRNAGIEYRHLKGLGNPKAGREAGKAGDTSAYLKIFTEHLNEPAGAADLLEAEYIARLQKTCLLCFERDPHHCHRALVVPRLAAATGQTVHHLFVERETPPLFAALG